MIRNILKTLTKNYFAAALKFLEKMPIRRYSKRWRNFVSKVITVNFKKEKKTLTYKDLAVYQQIADEFRQKMITMRLKNEYGLGLDVNVHKRKNLKAVD
jgi:hypothetical protein